MAVQEDSGLGTEPQNKTLYVFQVLRVAECAKVREIITCLARFVHSVQKKGNLKKWLVDKALFCDHQFLSCTLHEYVKN